MAARNLTALPKCVWPNQAKLKTTKINQLFTHYINNRGRQRIRTAVAGFADLCLATRPPDLNNMLQN